MAWLPFSDDVTHSFKLLASIKAKKWFTIGASLTVTTGKPYTQRYVDYKNPLVTNVGVSSNSIFKTIEGSDKYTLRIRFGCTERFEIGNSPDCLFLEVG